MPRIKAVRPERTHWIAVSVAIDGLALARVELSARHYATLSRQAIRERTTVADLLRPTVLVYHQDAARRRTDVAAVPAPDDTDQPDRP